MTTLQGTDNQPTKKCNVIEADNLQAKTTVTSRKDWSNYNLITKLARAGWVINFS